MKIPAFLLKHSALLRQIRPYRLQLLGIAAVFFLQIWLNVQVPIPFKKILNDILPSAPDRLIHLKMWGIDFGESTAGQALLTVAGLSVAIGIAAVIAGMMEAFATSEVVFRIQRNLRRELFGQLFTRRQTYLDSKRKVDLVGRVSGDVENLDIFFSNGFSAVVRDIPMILTLVVLIFSISQKLTFLFIGILFTYYFVMNFFTTRNRVASKALRRSMVQYEQDTFETLSSMAITKSLRGESKLQDSLMARIATLIANSQKQRNFAVGLDSSVGSLNFAVKGIMYFFGGWAMFKGELKLGDLAQVLAYMGIVERHINNINKFTIKLPKALASLERISELVEEMQSVPEKSGPEMILPAQVRGAKHALHFHDVTFFHEEHKFLLRNFSQGFGHGQLIAVAGTSGAGKSSFSRLLNRLSDPVSGQIFLGGKPLPSLDLGCLRDTVRLLSQETLLISASVRENLLLAMHGTANDDVLWEALCAVHADAFVRDLPLGLDTIIGEGGHQLSGGQAKRIHIARAFLDKNSEILLLDEPTSGLDAQSAEVVLSSVRALAASKSLVFWVTHQAPEIMKADSVLFFCAGRNPVYSTHEKLYASNNAYYALLQAGEGSPAPRVERAPALATV